METSQTDRDKLRELQRRLNPETIGRLVENPVQDPKKYRNKPKKQDKNQHPADREPSESLELEISYKSTYLSNDASPTVSPGKRKEKTERLLSELHEDLQAKPWLGMDQIEFDKLEWMSKKADKAYRASLKGTTQFDREGRAVPTASDQKGEKESTTHDIESLVQLLDSAYQPQVTYALNVIGRIAALATMGHYDGAFDDNIHNILIKNCLLRVRHQMDSSNETICQSALKCMRSLICNTQVDEVIIDRINSLLSDTVDPNLWLQTDEMSLKEFTIEMKDSECVEIDVVLCLTERTGILERMNYLLDNKNGVFLYNDCILDILIRLARHSPDVCYNIHQTDIIKKVVNLYLIKSAPAQSPEVQQLCVKALKLLRITCVAAHERAIIHSKFPEWPCIDTKIFATIIPAVETYFMIDCCIDGSSGRGDHLLKLNIETLRMMKALCLLKNCQAEVVGMLAISGDKLLKDFRTLRLLEPQTKLESTISYDWQYAANLIDLTGFVMNYETYHTEKSPLHQLWLCWVRPSILKWLFTIQDYRIIPHLDVSIAVATGMRYYNVRADERETKDMVDVLSEHVPRKGVEPRGVRFFKLLAGSAAEKSQLSNYTQESGRQRDPKGLPSYGSLNYNTSPEHKFKISSIFDTDSPYILLNMYVSKLHAGIIGLKQNSRSFLNSLDLIRYIRSASVYHKYSTNYELTVQESIFAQYEVQIISRAILSIARCYMSFTRCDEDPNRLASDIEPNDLQRSRSECYGNLCYYAISTIGLLNPNSGQSMPLKEHLLESVLLDRTIQKLVSKESYDKPLPDDEKEFAQADTLGEQMFRQLTGIHLNVLRPIYMSCEQPNRFWLFQPLLEYFLGKNEKDKSEAEKEEKAKNRTWFQRNMNWRSHTGELASASDTTIINHVLIFNLIMMQYSPCYTHFIIKSSFEDYLCIVGSLFLHDTVFLDQSVSHAISLNLKLMLKNCLIDGSDTKVKTLFHDPSRIIGPLDIPLADFFNQLVEQYEAVSFGDIAFANFLLLFIAPGSAKIFKKKLFQEKVETCLSQLRIGNDDVWAKEELFYSSREKDKEILELIQRSSAYYPKISSAFLHHYRAFQLAS